MIEEIKRDKEKGQEVLVGGEIYETDEEGTLTKKSYRYKS